MRIYAREDEQRIRTAEQVDAWADAGFVEAAQATTLRKTLATTLIRTHVMLRIALSLFTALVMAASVAFVTVLFSIRRDAVVSGFLAAAAAIAIAVAEAMIARWRLYRYGVEEALAMSAVVLLAIAAAIVMPSSRTTVVNGAMLISCLVAAIGFLAVYFRYGFVYAGVLAVVAAAAVPFLFRASLWAVRSASAFISLLAFAIITFESSRTDDEVILDDCATLRSAAWAMIYLAVNLQIITLIGIWEPARRSLFHWMTYGLVWLIPAAGLATSIRVRDRSFLATNAALALATLVTNKSYLGWTRYSWDPMVLGVVLVGTALWLRRWLSSGADGTRHGYTAQPLLATDHHAVAVLGNVSAALFPAAHTPAAAEPTDRFGGGRSGGGGASGSF